MSGQCCLLGRVTVRDCDVQYNEVVVNTDSRGITQLEAISLALSTATRAQQNMCGGQCNLIASLVKSQVPGYHQEERRWRWLVSHHGSGGYLGCWSSRFLPWPVVYIRIEFVVDHVEGWFRIKEIETQR